MVLNAATHATNGGLTNVYKTDLGTETFGESFHTTQSGSQLHTAAVQKHAKQGMGGTGVGYQL